MFRLLYGCLKEEKCDLVIARYLEVLMRDGDFVLVPRYIACLSKPGEQVVVLARLLEILEARLRRRALEPPPVAVGSAALGDEQLANFLDVRASCVKLAEQLELDVRGATRLLVERALALPSLAPHLAAPASARADESAHLSTWNNSIEEVLFLSFYKVHVHCIQGTVLIILCSLNRCLVCSIGGLEAHQYARVAFTLPRRATRCVDSSERIDALLYWLAFILLLFTLITYEYVHTLTSTSMCAYE